MRDGGAMISAELHDRRTWLELACLLTGVAVIFLLQFAISPMYDADSYLHIRMAEFLRLHGVVHAFPWARFTLFNEHFSDKDFLFHLMLVPFTYAHNIFAGGKLAAALLFAGLYAAYYLFLRAWGARSLIPLFLLAFFLCPLFVLNLLCTRPFAPILCFALLAIWLMIGRRAIAVAVLTLVYALTHLSAPYMLIFLAFVEGARYLSERTVCRRNLWGVLAGTVLGMLVHPYFPDNLAVFWQNGVMVPVYAMQGGVLELGGEFFPMNTRDALFRLAPAWAGFFGIMAFSIFSRQRPVLTLPTRVLFVFSLFYLVMGFVSQRSFNHGWLPFLLFFAAYLRDVTVTAPLAGRRLLLVYGAGVLLLGGYGVYVAREVRAAMGGFSAVNGHYETMGAFMRQQIPKGELIFTANWSDPQYFIGIDPDHYYFVTLDPVYMYSFDRTKYALYRDIAFGRCADPAQALWQGFGCRYGYIGKTYRAGLLDQVRCDPRFQILREDEYGLLFALRPPA